jgi:uncharacterized phage protein (TIGR02216 family)
MQLGLGHLRWPPETFWRASLPELMAASGQGAGLKQTFDAKALAQLQARFPDDRPEER